MQTLHVPTSDRFQAVAAELGVSPEWLASWLCEQFTADPPTSLAIPRAAAPTNPGALSADA